MLGSLLELIGKMDPMDKRSRLMAAILILVGLWTFIAPTITTDPPVLGRGRWSPFDILTQINDRSLPTHTEISSGTTEVEIYFVAVYFLLLLALVFVTFLPSTKGLIVVGLYNALLSSSGTAHRFGPSDLWYLFYGSRAPGVGHVYVGEHRLMLVAINLLLVGMACLNRRTEGSQPL